MSGPIVRKYGFPNFEKIFGAQDPQHGIDDAATAPAEASGAAGETQEPASAPEPKAKKAASTSRKKK